MVVKIHIMRRIYIVRELMTNFCLVHCTIKTNIHTRIALNIKGSLPVRDAYVVFFHLSFPCPDPVFMTNPLSRSYLDDQSRVPVLLKSNPQSPVPIPPECPIPRPGFD